MAHLQDIIRNDPNAPMKSGRLWLRKNQESFFAFGPNEKRELLFGVFAVVILLWVASVI